MKDMIEQSKLFSQIFSLISSLLLLAISMFVLGTGLIQLLLYVGLSPVMSSMIASKISIFVFAFALFKFDFNTMINLLKDKFNIRTLGKAILLLLVLIGINILFSMIVSTFIADSSSLENFNKSQLGILTNAGLFTLIIGTVILAPLSEELAFRAGLKKMLVDDGNWKPYQFVLISSLLFGLLHWQPGELSFLPILTTMGMGVAFSITYLKTNNILIPMIGHMLYNLFIVISAILV